MKLSHAEVHHIALLARVGLTEPEVNLMSLQLSNILENFEVLQQVDTDNVPPTLQSIPTMSGNVMREDEVVPSLTTEEVLANAPQRDGDYIKVRAILEQYS